MFINKRSDKIIYIQHTTQYKYTNAYRLYMNPEYERVDATPEEEAEIQRQGEGYTVETQALPDVNQNLLPYLATLPDYPNRCFNSTLGSGGTEGVYSSPGTPRVGKATLTRVYPSGSAKRSNQSAFLRSATDGATKDLSRGLQELPQSEAGPALCDEGRRLHKQHGSDSGIERDLEASEGPSKRRKGARSDSPTRDEGIELFREYISQVNAEHDCWIQANPWYTEALNVFDLYH